MARRTLESAPGASRRTQPCRPPRPLRSRSNAPTRPVCSPSGYLTRQIAHSAPVAPCTAHLCPTPCAQHVQPLNVPVREPVHVQYWAVAWSDRVGLLGLALALRARADISKSVRSRRMRLYGKAAQPMVWRGHGDPAGAPDAPWASPWRRMDEQVVGAAGMKRRCVVRPL